MRASFGGTVQVRYPEFVFFRLVDFYVLGARFKRLSWLLRATDGVCQQIPWVREYGYFLLVQFDRSRDPVPGAATATAGVAHGG